MMKSRSQVEAWIAAELLLEPGIERLVERPHREVDRLDGEAEQAEIGLVLGGHQLVDPGRVDRRPCIAQVELLEHLVREQQVRPGEEHLAVAMRGAWARDRDWR